MQVRRYVAKQEAQCEGTQQAEGAGARYAAQKIAQCGGTQRHKKTSAEVCCQADSVGADLSCSTQFNRRIRCGGMQRSRRTRCRSMQSRHTKAADIRRFILGKLRACFEISVGCLLSISAMF